MKIPGRTEPILPNFENIGETLKLALDVAEADYAGHLSALNGATDAGSRVEAISALERSAKASDQISQAMQYFLMSQNSFKHSTTEMLRGNETSAAAKFGTSAQHMRAAADLVDHFSTYPAHSSLFDTALAVVAKRDAVAANVGAKIDGAAAAVEHTIARTGAGFARGLKAFATSMHSFSDRIAKVPEQIRSVARAGSVSVIEATASVAQGMLSRTKALLSTLGAGAVSVGSKLNERKDAFITAEEQLRGKVRGTVEEGVGILLERGDEVAVALQEKVGKVQEAAIIARQAAWQRMDQFAVATAEVALQVKDGTVDVGQAIERHSKAGLGVLAAAGGLIRTLGGKVGSQYASGLEAAREAQAERRGPRP